jgi:hypothetical protein
LRPQCRHARAQVLQRDQFLLIGGHQAIDRGCHTRLLPEQVVEPVARRIGVSCRLSAARQFGLD